MNALRHGLAAAQPDDRPASEQIRSPTLKEVQARLRQVEAERLKLLGTIDRSLADGAVRELRLALKHLEALNRYIKRAHTKLKHVRA